MTTSLKSTYLLDLDGELSRPYPENRPIYFVCHGHSVPAGYFRTPVIDPFNAYPHLFHQGLKEKYPFALLDVIVTAVGGENSEQGAKRFQGEVLSHAPDLVTIDYGLNDRSLGLERAAAAWRKMIEAALQRGIQVMLLTPTLDHTVRLEHYRECDLFPFREQICALAAEYQVALADSFTAWILYLQAGAGLNTLLSQSNHPNRLGHELVAREMLDWFPM